LQAPQMTIQVQNEQPVTGILKDTPNIEEELIDTTSKGTKK